MPRSDDLGIFWQDMPVSRKKSERVLGPIPAIPETGWRPPTEFPNIKHAKAISLDTETRDDFLTTEGPGWARGKSHLVGVSLAVDGGKWYFPMRHTVQPELNMDPAQVMKYIQWALSGKGVKIGANIIYDIGTLAAEGIKVGGKFYDVQIAQSLIDEMSKLSLDELGYKYLDHGKKTEVLENWARDYYGTTYKQWRRDIYRCPVSLVGPYAEDDASMPYDILRLQWPKLQQHNLLDIFEMECGLIPLLVKMRFAGVSIDLDKAEELRGKLSDKEAILQKQLDDLAGTSVNVNSGEEIAYAFDKAELTYPRTAPSANAPDGNPSFVKEFLENHKHPLPQLITKVRGVAKLRGTFVEGYLINSHVNGKVHGEFHLTKTERGGTRTGRLASSGPNLQNIPMRTAEGKLIRECFIMDPGHVAWRKYDLSQIEYRFLAHFAEGEGSEALRQRYINDPNTDFHQMTADLIKAKTGIELPRSETKSINFGIVYGLGIVSLAESLGLSVPQAKELLVSYHTGAPFAKATMEAISENVQETGIVKTIMGRISHFDMWEPMDWASRSIPHDYESAVDKWGEYNIIRAYAYRAINYKLQGSAADQMKMSMLKCYQSGVFDVTGVPRLTVHDELDFSDPGGCDEAFREVKRIMETSIPLRIPVLADYEIGPNWGQVKKAA